ncbi:aminotransferase class I/II-fold pyridoxal phosphate-dependent enzyme [Clostridium facile]|uniref:Methionine gamma-lyase family protein n=1 Tax=Clostridium facile TaxID=2763035 RepID=A0ABR7IN14_9CLOT|nr:methionine gamma-lyase family protein [Clostridium facile]MBC5786529.1 methionine gamma-lyase family protein [Clostridium facile]
MIENFFSIDGKLLKLAQQAEVEAQEAFAQIEENSAYNEAKVLKAFIDNRVSESHFAGSTGYGYGDRGREALDAVFAQALGAEDALVRHNFVSGTHALTTALFGVLRAGDTMVSITGKPYDTMEEVIGIRGEGNGSLKDFGVSYRQVDLLENGEPDYDRIPEVVKGAKVVYLQRSRGYSLRPSFTIEVIGKMIAAARSTNPDAIVVVDNCYGEFVEKKEPLAVGADLIIGSLIKNPGGGIAETGGYIAGRKDLVELCSYRLTCPGMGKEVGCTLGQSRSMFMGLFFAPSVVANALKTSCFALKLFELLGFEVYPKCGDPRTDIIAAIQLGTPEGLVAFCQGIQKGSPVDAFVAPEPWDMPGYDSEVIMAAGAFTLGASIELSADAPLKEPYAVWLQGGLTYASGKTGILLAAQSMLEKGLLKL